MKTTTRRRTTTAPVQININPVEFANMCEERDTQSRQACLGHIADPFMAELAVYSLIELQGRIIGLEYFLSHNPANDVSNIERVDKYKKEHLQLHTQLSTALGEKYQEIYDKVLADENQSARTNLDNSDGRMYCYVVPKFNPDGSHEPVGPRDVPWNASQKRAGKKPRR